MTTAALVTRLRTLSRRFGGLGLAAVLLLLVALGVVFILVPQHESALAALRAEADAARVRALRLARTAAPGAANAAAADPAERFREGFPLAASRQPRVAALLDLATAQGLAATRSEYRYQVEPALGLARYRVTLPLAGPYDALRRFIEEALRSDPALSLDSVRLRRADGRAAQVQAELQFSLLMRLDVPAQAVPVQAVLAELSR